MELKADILSIRIKADKTETAHFANLVMGVLAQENPQRQMEYHSPSGNIRQSGEITASDIGSSFRGGYFCARDKSSVAYCAVLDQLTPSLMTSIVGGTTHDEWGYSLLIYGGANHAKSVLASVQSLLEENPAPKGLPPVLENLV